MHACNGDSALNADQSVQVLQQFLDNTPMRHSHASAWARHCRQHTPHLDDTLARWLNGQVKKEAGKKELKKTKPKASLA